MVLDEVEDSETVNRRHVDVAENEIKLVSTLEQAGRFGGVGAQSGDILNGLVVKAAHLP
jgi:hypothetical protein